MLPFLCTVQCLKAVGRLDSSIASFPARFPTSVTSWQISLWDCGTFHIPNHPDCWSVVWWIFPLRAVPLWTRLSAVPPHDPHVWEWLHPTKHRDHDRLLQVLAWPCTCNQSLLHTKFSGPDPGICSKMNLQSAMFPWPQSTEWSYWTARSDQASIKYATWISILEMNEMTDWSILTRFWHRSDLFHSTCFQPSTSGIMMQAIQPMTFYWEILPRWLVFLPGHGLDAEYIFSLDTLRLMFNSARNGINLLRFLLRSLISCWLFQIHARSTGEHDVLGQTSCTCFHQDPIKACGRTWRVTKMHN